VKSTPDSIIQTIDTCRRGQRVTETDVLDALKFGKDYQVTALLFALKETANPLFQFAMISLNSDDRKRKIVSFLATIFQNNSDSAGSVERIVASLRSKQLIGPAHLQHFVRQLTAGTLPTYEIATFLMASCLYPMTEVDLVTFTNALRDSGSIYDYRNAPQLNGKQIVRRYPTGGISEKVALLLPSAIAAVGEEYKVCTAFTVANSLSFTGGTWDKLSVIPGFTFPHPGEQTVRILSETGSAMIVANHDLCPADRILYRLRSVTGTVEGDDLIVSSIASKQLACPSNVLLLDVRFGKAAFLPTIADAQRIANKLQSIISKSGAVVGFAITENRGADGQSIGNTVELLEAIQLMKGVYQNSPQHRQTFILKLMFSELMQLAQPQIRLDWSKKLDALISDGSILRRFRQMIVAHNVSPRTADQLIESPEQVLLSGLDRYAVCASRAGIIAEVDYRRLGLIANYQLGAGANEFLQVGHRDGGLVLLKREGDSVREGESIAMVWLNSDAARKEVCHSVINCFSIT
jgi:pyrimidine-nucleoside phosphorylase